MEHTESIYRTKTCVELRAKHVGEIHRLGGWIERKRDHGGVVFVDLRDHYGKTQVVFNDELREEIQSLRVESVISVEGQVKARGEELVNPKLETGEIELHATGFEVLSKSAVLPFQVAEDDSAPENARLKHRFLELRRDKLHENMVLRSKVITRMRELMTELGFTEYQTPILTSSSPEGARDFIVPSRLHPGKFFALPQAPQQFKQLLMVAGFDRYFQIAPCFRDEDARADRSPGEFYQLDMELSFVEEKDVHAVNEELMVKLIKSFSDWPVTETPFPRLSYQDAMNRFGSDKPDLRNPLEIIELSSVFEGTEFRVFQSILAQGGAVFGLPVPVSEIPSRKYFDDRIDAFSKQAGTGLAYLVFSEDEVKGSIKKFVSEKEIDGLQELISDFTKPVVLFFAAGQRKDILPWIGRLREELGQEFKLLDEESWKFCWITDFPMYERDPKTNEIEFGHNPFSMPRGGLEALESDDPESIFCSQYDMVLNGNELASGAIRNHSPEIMYKAFEIAGYGPEVVEKKFGGMIRAFQYGAPPHGGIAYGIERIVMLLAGEEAIREVIMFPLAQTGEDLLMGAPSEITDAALKDVHIKLDLPPEAQKDS